MSADRCHDCDRPATRGVRCARHAERHRLANLRRSRSQSPNQTIAVYRPRTCGSCGETGHDRRICTRTTRLLAEVDAIKGKATFVARGAGWRCVLTGLGLPPHYGEGRTPADALDEALRFARALGETG